MDINERFYLELMLAVFSVWVLFAEVVIKAPMSKNSRGGWGPTINSTAGWVIMEAPAIFVFAYAFLSAGGGSDRSWASFVLVALWVLHYFHRSFIYPFTHLQVAKPLNVAVMLSGACYTGLAGYAFGSLAGETTYNTATLLLPSFWLGVLCFIAGWYVNRHSDNILYRLKSEGKGYKIPHGGLFEYVSCANYTGELLMWGGWALATLDLLALLWFINCFCNIGTRAVNNHRWYQGHFPNYPKARRALIPFVL